MCAPKLGEALEIYNGTEVNHPLTNEKQSQLENKLVNVETKLHEIKEELIMQLSKCHEILSTSVANTSKPPSGSGLIANTVFTAINEERDREETAKFNSS